MKILRKYLPKPGTADSEKVIVKHNGRLCLIQTDGTIRSYSPVTNSVSSEVYGKITRQEFLDILNSL